VDPVDPAPPPPPPDEPPPSQHVVNIVCALLVVVVCAQVVLVIGRAAGCFYWNVRCSDAEFSTALDSIGALVGVVVALLFAVARLK